VLVADENDRGDDHKIPSQRIAMPDLESFMSSRTVGLELHSPSSNTTLPTRCHPVSKEARNLPGKEGTFEGNFLGRNQGKKEGRKETSWERNFPENTELTPTRPIVI
jgi:hypothetical protein